MKIISAARRTGKSTYIADTQRASDIVIVPSYRYKKHCEYPFGIMTIDQLLDDTHLRGLSTRYEFIFEEPGSYDFKFAHALKLLESFGYKVKLVIGTPVGNLNMFDWFLHAHKKQVIRWSHAEIPEDFRICGGLSQGELEGKF